MKQRVTFTADQALRLAAEFPNGVCDWPKPAVGQTNAQPTTFDQRAGWTTSSTAAGVDAAMTA